MIGIAIFSCGNNGKMGIIEVTVQPDPSYIYIDEVENVKVCEAVVKLEEKGGVGIHFIKEEIKYIDMNTEEVFFEEELDSEEIKDTYSSNYLPAHAWVELRIKDIVSLDGPESFYVEDRVFCMDEKGNEFEVYYKRRCLPPPSD